MGFRWKWWKRRTNGIKKEDCDKKGGIAENRERGRGELSKNGTDFSLEMAGDSTMEREATTSTAIMSLCF